ncbi:MAG: hypothetical protein K2Q33_05870 [Gammaproteobacteria bacterium]|nr:hypothetical protein [Gammaproteobacteria bacterium]
MAVSLSALSVLKQQVVSLQKALEEAFIALDASDVQRFNQKKAELLAQSDVAEANCLAEWYCPISQELMVDPVVAQDEHTYERTAIELWLSKNNTSPLTGGNCEKLLTRNRALYNQIEPVLGPKLTQLKGGLEVLLNEVKAFTAASGLVNSNITESMPTLSSSSSQSTSVSVRPSSLTAFDDSLYTPQKLKSITGDLKRGLSIGGQNVGNDLVPTLPPQSWPVSSSALEPVDISRSEALRSELSSSSFSLFRNDSRSQMVSSSSSSSRSSSSSSSTADRGNNDAQMAVALEIWSLSSLSSSGAQLFSEMASGIAQGPKVLSPLEVRHYTELKHLRDKLYALKNSPCLNTPKYEKLRQNIADLETEVRVQMLKYKEIYIGVNKIPLEQIVPPYNNASEAMQNCLSILRRRFTESTITHIYTPNYKLSFLFGNFESEVFSPRGVEDSPQSPPSSFFGEVMIDNGARLQEEIDYLGIPGRVESAMLHQYKSGNVIVRGIRIRFDCDVAMVWNIAAAVESMRQEFSPSPEMALRKSHQYYEAMQVVGRRGNVPAQIDYEFNIVPLDQKDPYGNYRSSEMVYLYQIIDNLILHHEAKVVQFYLEIPGERFVRERNGEACLVLFDVTDRPSFERAAQTLKSSLPKIAPEKPFILVGMNCLSVEAREVTIEEAENTATQTGHNYIEISSEQQFNLDSLFSLLCQQLIPKPQPAQHFRLR